MLKTRKGFKKCLLHYLAIQHHDFQPRQKKWFPAASNFWNLMSSKSNSWGWGDVQLSSHPTSKPKSALLCVIVCQSVVSLCFRLVELELCSVVHISNPAVPTQKHQVGSNCSCQPALAVGPKKRDRGIKDWKLNWCVSVFGVKVMIRDMGMRKAGPQIENAAVFNSSSGLTAYCLLHYLFI